VEKDIANLSELETFARGFLVSHPEGAVVGLSGDLGAGKTTFVRSCISVLSAKAGTIVPRVTSPTYVLHQRYPKLSNPIEHFDLYRLDNISQMALTDLGYFDAVDFAREKKGFVFVEWPEKCREISHLMLDSHVYFSVEGHVRILKVVP